MGIRMNLKCIAQYNEFYALPPRIWLDVMLIHFRLLSLHDDLRNLIDIMNLCILSTRNAAVSVAPPTVTAIALFLIPVPSFRCNFIFMLN